MKFIEALAEDKTCSNEAEVLAKAQPYWFDTGSPNPLTEMYSVINNINPSISHVILRMCLDYYNLKSKDSNLEDKDSTEPSILVAMTDALDKDIIQKTTPYFDEQTKDITIRIAKFNRGSLTENPTLNKFMTMAYYHGYLTMIEKKYLAIPNRE
ncbi:hypothetical protein EV182_008905, partial [Spiromyces aspiralis]